MKQFTVGKRPQKKPQSNNTQQQSNNMNEQPVDVDLSSHAMSHKISRRHFSIHLHHRTSSKEAKDKDTEQDNNYIEFVLSNHSRRPVSVDHKEVPQQCTLTDNSSIQVVLPVCLCQAILFFLFYLYFILFLLIFHSLY